ncbi:hypothetical protein [Rhodoferax sp.]|uniref:hypothetical protein n=1 Tax=Rhodoferax sp. TaxID=50421 RepID=UPI00261D4672|nr:hypothetical protein [Rhodoferax sp.]MDD2808778.1 hypothetical protein [Rhodoferax sp.]
MARQSGEKNIRSNGFGNARLPQMALPQYKDEYDDETLYRSGGEKNWRATKDKFRMIGKNSVGVDIEEKEVENDMQKNNNNETLTLSDIKLMFIEVLDEKLAPIKQDIIETKESISKLREEFIVHKTIVEEKIPLLATSSSVAEISNMIEKTATKENLSKYAETPVFKNAVEVAVNNGRNKFFDSNFKIFAMYTGILVTAFGSVFGAIYFVNSTNSAQLSKINESYVTVVREIEAIKGVKNNSTVPVMSANPASSPTTP